MFRDVPGCSGMFHVPGFVDGQRDPELNSCRLTARVINQTDCRADTTAKGLFIWANISTSITSLLQAGPELQ